MQKVVEKPYTIVDRQAICPYDSIRISAVSRCTMVATRIIVHATHDGKSVNATLESLVFGVCEQLVGAIPSFMFPPDDIDNPENVNSVGDVPHITVDCIRTGMSFEVRLHNPNPFEILCTVVLYGPMVT